MKHKLNRRVGSQELHQYTVLKINKQSRVDTRFREIWHVNIDWESADPMSAYKIDWIHLK